MNLLTTLTVLLLVAGTIYLTYWAIQKTLKEETGKNRRARRRR
ncbi:MAG: hypothetical protein AAF694_03905 [Bacteroidota bacterium]